MRHYLSETIYSPAAWAGAVIGMMIKIFTPTVEVGVAFLCLFFLWMFDCLLGIISSAKRGEGISGQRFFAGFGKVVAWAVAVLAFHLMKGITPSTQWAWDWCVWISMGAFGLRQLLGVLEHVVNLGANVPKSVIRFIKGLNHQVQEAEPPKSDIVGG